MLLLVLFCVEIQPWQLLSTFYFLKNKYYYFQHFKDILCLNLILINKAMQLSVDQKIQAAIQPLIQRITILEAENQKFKQQIVTLHTAVQPKTAHKPALKTQVDAIERPQTTKGNRKKSVQNHEVKPDKKLTAKKQDPKGQGEELKTQSLKQGGAKTPIVSNKAISSPNNNKDHNPSNNVKDIKNKPPTGVGNRISATTLNNKSIVGEKKPLNKSIEHEHEKKEGQSHEEKKENTSHEKVEQNKPNSNHIPKTPANIKVKPAQKQPEIKKPAPGHPTAGIVPKKPSKPPVVDHKKKLSDAKAEAIKGEQKQEIKEEHKQQEVKGETKQEEAKGEAKQEEAKVGHNQEEPKELKDGQNYEQNQPVQKGEKQNEENLLQSEIENKQPAQEEAL